MEVYPRRAIFLCMKEPLLKKLMFLSLLLSSLLLWAIPQNKPVTVSTWNVNVLVGTHRIGLGADFTGSVFWPQALLGSLPLPGAQRLGPEYLGLSGMIGAMAWGMDFGIPGMKKTARADMKLLYCLGEAQGFEAWLPWARGRHSLSFGFNGYLANDGTSQVSGQLDYLYTAGIDAFLINYENDTMKPWPADEYRTGAFRLSWLRSFGGHMAGLAAGFNLWAGQRVFDIAQIWNGGDIAWPTEMARGQTVSLYYAGEYAVDVVYVCLLFDHCALSAGYDSELFKRLIHNSIHWILNDGNLPEVDRPDRFYLEFRIGEGRSLW